MGVGVAVGVAVAPGLGDGTVGGVGLGVADGTGDGGDGGDGGLGVLITGDGEDGGNGGLAFEVLAFAGDRSTTTAAGTGDGNVRALRGCVTFTAGIAAELLDGPDGAFDMEATQTMHVRRATVARSAAASVMPRIYAGLRPIDTPIRLICSLLPNILYQASRLYNKS